MEVSLTTRLKALSLEVRNRGSSLNASDTSLLKRLKRVSSRSTYFSESCVITSADSTMSAEKIILKLDK